MMVRALVSVLAGAALLAPIAAHADSVPDELRNAVRILTNTESYHYAAVKANGKATVEVRRPDRARLFFGGWEIIRIGLNVWGRPRTGGWQVLSTAGPGKIAELMAVSLPPHPTIRRVADASDGAGAAHVFAVDGDPSGGELLWYVRVSDGRVHRIYGPTLPGHAMTVEIDYDNVPITIEPPM
jgi:hypothetical protein